MILTLSMSGCFLTRQTREADLIGRYRCITDFSRDIMSMKGQKRTIVYKNGRQETIHFLADHTFSRKVHFTSDRIKDEKMLGAWKLGEDQLIEVSPLQKHSLKSAAQKTEYYRFQGETGVMIRLSPDKRRLAPEYAPFYTFYRL